MNKVNEIIKKLLFISDQICEIYEDLYDLSMTNQEKSSKYDDTIEFFENYLSQESILLDKLNKNELIAILQNLFEHTTEDAAINRCYETVKYYFLNKYPIEKAIIDEIEGINIEELDFSYEKDVTNDEENIDITENPEYLEIEYEDESDTSQYINYVNLKIKITAIKKMYQNIKNTATNNKIDNKYKKELLKQLKGFKCDFFFQNRDTELLGIKCHFDANKLPNLPKLNENISSICYNECINILDELYLTPSNERDIYTILETLFSMLCFDEYIKELTEEQIDRLIEICYQIEANISKSFFGNIGLQKLVKIKKN